MNFFFAKCPAKINLFLKLTGRRDDGYHELESLFTFLDLADELEILKQVQDDDAGLSHHHPKPPHRHSEHRRPESPHRHPELVSGSKTKIEITGEFAPFLDPKKNLFIEILDFFAAEFGITKNLHIKIKKNIPVGAGLGGGSSNAAFFMKGLNEIFLLNLSKKKLQEISLRFGSDIAFFFEDRASLVKGRGEIIENFSNFEPITALLVNPKIALSTKEVFKKFAIGPRNECGVTGGRCSPDFVTPHLLRGPENLLQKNIFELLENFPNDLTNPAISILPVISEILDNLKNSGAQIAKMSGSGASCFGIFYDEKKLDEAAKKFPKFFVKKVKILSHV